MSTGGSPNSTKFQKIPKLTENSNLTDGFTPDNIRSSGINSPSTSFPVKFITQATSIQGFDDISNVIERTLPRLEAIREQSLDPISPKSRIPPPTENRRDRLNRKHKFFCRPVASASDPVHDIGDDVTQSSTIRRNQRLYSNYQNEISLKEERYFNNLQNPSSFTSLSEYGYERRIPGPLVKLNICGTPFIVKLNTLRKDPMVFERILEDAEWISETGEYYLERDPGVFRFVYSYLRYNEMHLPQNICGPLLEKELETWGLQLGFDLQRCCLGPVVQSKSNLESLKKFEQEFTQTSTKTSACFGNSSRWNKIRDDVWHVIGDTPKKRWLAATPKSPTQSPYDETPVTNYGNTLIKLLDNGTPSTFSSRMNTNAITINNIDLPDSLSVQECMEKEDNISTSNDIPHQFNWRNLQRIPKLILFGRIYLYMQAVVICSLIIMIILCYVPELREPFGPNLVICSANNNSFQYTAFPVNRMYFAFDEVSCRLTRPKLAIIAINWVCVIHFTLDLIARAIFCPDILRWIRSIYTLTDVLSLTPFYVEGCMYITIDKFPNDVEHTQKMLKLLRVLDIVNLLKIFVAGRLFRLLQRQRPTRVLLYTVRHSAFNMLMIFELMALCAISFGTAIFLLDNEFESIFTGMWWALVTMATVGYGDVVPSTTAGYILAVFCVIAGILLTSYTVPILVSDFMLYYSHADQLAWMRRVHTSATAKRKRERRNLITKRGISRIKALIKGTTSIGYTSSKNSAPMSSAP